jgi:hypothetical protein
MIRDDMKFDVRTLKYRVRRSELTPEEIQKHLDDLPDETQEAETTHTQFIATFEGRNYRQ